MKLRARWLGPPPKIGDYLMSEVRPRFAYRVEQVTRVGPYVHWDQGFKAEARVLQIVAERVAVSAVPKHARVHPWKWDKREAKHGAASRSS